MVSPLVHIVMIGWIPVVLAIFALVRGHRAVIVSFLLAWLFLPMFGYDMEGIPDYTKVSATTAAVLMAAFLFDSGRVFSFRPRWFDLPILVFAIVPMISAITSGNTYYEGMSDTVDQTVRWVIPYFLGRLYFTDLASQRDMAIGLMLGGMVYVPLCAIEMRLSPQLHHWVYGYHQHDFAQTVRMGGYRPTVFMQHGIAVASFMATATLAAFWLWMSRSLKTIWNMPLVFIVPVLLVTTILCRSAGAMALLVGAMGALLWLRFAKSRLAIACLCLVPLVYMGARTAGGWSGGELLDLAKIVHEERAASLETRLSSEDALWGQAMQKPLFGWGRGGGSMARDEEGRELAIPDGLWVILAGLYGLTGLGAFVSFMLIGPARLLARVRSRYWMHPAMAGAAVMSVLLAIHMIDNLMNAMINPIFVLGAGGLAGLTFSPARRTVVYTPLEAPVEAAPEHPRLRGEDPGLGAGPEASPA